MSKREEFRSRTLDIARRANAKYLSEQRLSTGADLLTFAGPLGLVLVIIDDHGCHHFNIGGGQWADLERDMGVEDAA